MCWNEHPTQRIEIEADTDEGEQPADPQMPRPAKDHAQPQCKAERSDEGREASRECGLTGQPAICPGTRARHRDDR